MKKISSVLLLSLWSMTSFAAFDAGEYYEKKCTSCHTIGGGDDVGPDLKGVNERRQEAWLIKFIKNSEAVIASGDPVANEMFGKFKNKKMPAQEISDDEIKELLALIKTGKAGGAANYTPVTNPNPFEIQKGRELFTGVSKFENGGPSCVSCHSSGHEDGIFGGGTLGPNLVHSYPNYMDKGLNKVIGKISFPTMIEVYAKAKITDQENYYLRSYLFDENKKRDPETEAKHGSGAKKFALFGVSGTFVALLGIDFVWRRRRKKTRRPY